MPTFIIASVLALIVAGIIVKLIRDKKQGKSSCGCSCQGCGNEGFCHSHKDH